MNNFFFQIFKCFKCLQLDVNLLINGDSIFELKKIPDHTIDIVITDPPYGVNYISNWSKDQTRPSKIPIT